jgi:alpha-beta hydrolase superfamily lysophospholipase
VHVERLGDPRAAARMIVLHGAGGHAAALFPVAAAAAQRGGFRVAVPDLPGYGRTTVPRRSAVRYGDWVDLVCDLVRAEKQAHPDTPLHLLGASMGGLLAYDAATRTGLVDRVVATCLLDPRERLARRCISHAPWIGEAAPAVLRLAAGPLAGVPVPLRWLTNMRAISNAPELTHLVLRDRRGGGNRMPLGFFRSFLESAPEVEPEQATGPRIVLAHPGEDRWTPLEVSLRFFDRLAAPKELVVLANAGHYPVEPPGVHRLVEAIGVAEGGKQ